MARLLIYVTVVQNYLDERTGNKIPKLSGSLIIVVFRTDNNGNLKFFATGGFYGEAPHITSVPLKFIAFYC